jgi:hypothetical protein
MSANTDLLARMASLGAHLMPLVNTAKQPTSIGWPLALALTASDADAHLARGGNIGVNLASSRLICLDAENIASTNAVKHAGFTLTVITAKAQVPTSPKYGGSHTWLRVPEGVDTVSLCTRLGITLPGGGTIDVLAGARYAVAPPSRIDEAPGFMYAPCRGGPLDPAVYGADPDCDLDVAPMWLFDPQAPGCPQALEPLHGILAPKTAYERVEADAHSQELTDRIDEADWDQWLGGDNRLIHARQTDGCGCGIYHWVGADNTKSATLHDGCPNGSGAHIWSGTMIGALGLDSDHLSRLDLAAALRGCSRREAAASVGIQLGRGDDEALAPVRPEHLVQTARDIERIGQHQRAAVYRQAAKVLRARMPASAGHAMISEHTALAGGTPPMPEELQRFQQSSTAITDGTAALNTDTDPVVGADYQQRGSDTGKRREVIRLPGMPMSKMPTPAADEIYEYPYPPIPDHVSQVRGARTEFAKVLPPLVNRQSCATVAHEWIFSATPGLSQIAAAADSRGVGRWGMLGALLPRVAAHVPPTVRLTPADGSVPAGNSPTASGTSINLYSVLVGPPASGKSVTLSAADALVPGVRMIPPGTGEGILKLFPRVDTNNTDDANAGHGGAEPAHVGSVDGSWSPDSVLLSSDEIDVFVGEMVRQGSKTTGFYRSMWMGGDVGNITSDRERHSMVGAHTYRFGIRLGAQPETVSPLFDETERGTPQRFLWLGAQRMIARGGHYPERLAIAPVYWFEGLPSMIPPVGAERPPVWITPPPAARKFMADELWRSATANPLSPSGGYDDADGLVDRTDSIAERHAVLQRLKISAVLAVLDGLAQPQDVHWYASEAIMDVRKTVICHLVEVAEMAQRDKAIKHAREQGMMRVHADAAGGRETRERRRDAQVAVLVAADRLTTRREPITWLSLCAEVVGRGGNPDFVADAIKALAVARKLTPVSDGHTYVLTPQGDGPNSATVAVLRAKPAPTIYSVGG